MNKVCSKLYIAGEYAILENNHLAILQNIDKEMSAKIFNSEKGIIKSSIFNDELYWHYSDKPVFKKNNNYKLIQETITLVIQYLQEKNIKINTFSLEIVTDLYDKNHKKYGLGSNGATVVLVTKTILTFFKVKFEKIFLFKLASLVLLKINSNSSLGDVACIAFNNLILYQSFDRDYIKKQLSIKSITEILKMTWPNLKIKELKNNLKYNLLIAWSQKEANSEKLINFTKSINNESAYKDFLRESNNCVKEISNAFKTNNKILFKENINKNREILNNLSSFSKIKIENKSLTNIINTINNFDACGKTSGAGLGDCVIVYVFNKNDTENIKRIWQEKNIFLLKEIVHE